MQLTGDLFIEGHWTSGSGAAMDSRAPHDGHVLWQGREADETDIGRAAASAAAAFERWAETPLASREAVATRFGALLDDSKDALARCIAEETGKPLWEARTEVGAMVGKIAISIRALHERAGTRSQDTDFGRHVLRHRPHGIVAVFGPYNFPGHLPNGHIVPALLAGNTVLFKPSEQTPAVGEFVVRLWQQAGLPAGALSLLQGGRDTGSALAAHPRLDGLYFTGSAATGTALHRQFAGQPGRILALEMGGNNPLIVLDDAPVEAAVVDIVQSAFITAGQRCSCARRLLLPETPAGDAILTRLIEVASTLRIDRWDAEPQPYYGPLISPTAATQMLDAQTRLQAAGGRVLLPMTRMAAGAAFVSPGIVDMSAAQSAIDEEFFGPLLQVFRFGDFDQALSLANDTRYGLAAGLLGGDAETHERFFRRIRAGIVNWNRATTGASSTLPFGGSGISGNHRPGAYYAADYCAYPVASAEATTCALPATLPPGLAEDLPQGQ